MTAPPWSSITFVRGSLIFVDAAQRMSQFIEGIAAPIFGDFGDGDEIGAALSYQSLRESAFAVAIGGKADMPFCCF